MDIEELKVLCFVFSEKGYSVLQMFTVIGFKNSNCIQFILQNMLYKVGLENT